MLSRHRFPIDSQVDAPRRERVIAAGRVTVAAIILLATWIDPPDPAHFQLLFFSLLIVYGAYALGTLYLVRSVRLRAAMAMHVIDLAWATVFTSLTGGGNSPMFLFFSFPVMAAATRWGFWETAATTIFAVVAPILENWLVPILLGPDSNAMTEVALNRVIPRIGFFLILGSVLGYLSEQEKRWRGEVIAIASVMRLPSVSAGMAGTMRAVGGEMLRLFRSPLMILVAREQDSPHVAVWQVQPTADTPSGICARLDRIPAEQAERYFFEAPRAFRAEAAGRLRRNGELEIPPAFLEAHPCTSMLASSLQLMDLGAIRVFILDSSLPGRRQTLQFLQTLIEHVAPAMHSVYLLRRLRSRAGAVERARVARELHDGAIQSLIALEMEIQALRSRTSKEAPSLEPDLAYMQDVVSRQVLELRELMNQLRPLDLESTDRLPDLLAAIVEKFRRDTGISARFVTSTDRLQIDPRAAVEVARIVQESLVNVRRHSRARNVLVSLSTESGQWRLRVDDDGRGFDFEGKLSERELDERRQGPTVIRERARAIGAALSIESHRGTGSRVELTLPEVVRA